MKRFDMSNHGEWDVAHLDGDGIDCWQAFRLRDKEYPDIPANREYAGPVFGNEAEARIWLKVNQGVLPE